MHKCQQEANGNYPTAGKINALITGVLSIKLAVQHLIKHAAKTDASLSTEIIVASKKGYLAVI